MNDLGFEDNSIEVVTNMLSFHHYHEPKKAMEEMYRVLQFGGKSIILDVCPTPFWKPKYNMFGIAIGDGHRSFYTKEEMKEFFEAAGFIHIEQIHLSKTTLVTIGEKQYETHL